ncbi:phytanoyl-CoA dioxygenase family protein [Tsukamurella sp. 8F]|uniref:phytanoyl-CoA dioxygenase family protein n=1 Tax=unclassified Tsukamurella TaxID=2633480 RepID=UPI0023B8A776|nr:MULTISPECIES: phytanoyl-CoA dioxygenase family protein [unclassified Tsukamurella]MDF0528470.1 phytanoyl-CoA dioxygenase family protein [Tsukamurella sp. 8J]MDF0586296.1 phytanoyl-CoA dioxygenase family protein [Tsukamurella sp. 8F]
MLTDEQVETFVRDGFIAVRRAFAPEIASAARNVLWDELEQMGVERDAPSTWDRPVIRLGEHGEAPFRAAATAPALAQAADRLVGPERWVPRVSLGTFPVRFPSEAEPGDDGWHVDASFPGDEPDDFLRWRVNAHSRGRALLMLFLFSDVDIGDAPTRIRVGSHRRLAGMLQRYGEEGAEIGALGAEYAATSDLPEAAATGRAGDVYLCHPFLVHAAQPLRPGPDRRPRFLAQPPLLGAPADLAPDGDLTPVARAIVAGCL